MTIQEKIRLEEACYERGCYYEGQIEENGNIDNAIWLIENEPKSKDMDPRYLEPSWENRIPVDDQELIDQVREDLEKRGIHLSKLVTEYYIGFLFHLIAEYPVIK